MFNGSNATENGLTHIRNVALLPGETIRHVFSPKLGLMHKPPENGQLLVATSQRVLAFCHHDGRNEIFLVSVGELQSVALKARSRTATSMVQGALLAVGGILLYVAVAYWLTGRFDGPSVPVINMDVAPLLMLLLTLVGVAPVGRHYFSKQDGSVTFQGSNWTFAFPYRGDKAGQDIFQVVNTVFAVRQSHDSHSFFWED